MACRRFSLSITTCGLMLIALVLPGLFVLLMSPTAEHVGAQELGPKQAYLSGQRSVEVPLNSANQTPTNQAAKPSGKMGFVPASPTPRDGSAKAPRSVANPVTRRAVPQPPKYAVSAGASPDASRTQKSNSRSVVSRPTQPQPNAVAQPQPNTVANQAVARTSPPPVPTPRDERPEPMVESLELAEPTELMEPTVVETRKPPIRTLDEPVPEETPALDEPAPVITTSRNVVQSFFDDDAADEESDDMMVPDEQPVLAARRDDAIQPVPARRDVAQEAAPSIDSDRSDFRELFRKQAYVSAQRSAEAPRNSANHASANQAAKPSGKMSFIPASPSARESSPSASRSVANPVTRHAVPQPPKYAISAGASPEAPRTQHPGTRSVVSRPAKPQPSAVANKTPFTVPNPQQSERPQQPVEKLESPFETPQPVFAATRQAPIRTLEEPTFEQPMLADPVLEKKPVSGVVQLFFEDEPADGDSDESMDLGGPSAPTARPEEIRHVAAQGDSTPGTAKVQKVDQSDAPAETDKDRMAKIMADLKPVRQIDLGLAVRLPKPGKNDSDKVREPDDQAFAILRQHKPFNVFAIARDPWLANRDSYPFHHKPLWFEDPNLERCGRGWGPFTTTVSAIHFSANTIILPYRFSAEKPWSCVRTLPDCTVCEKFGYEAYLPPWSWCAAATQAAATVGIIYLVP